jgi:hypothetical protein
MRPFSLAMTFYEISQCYTLFTPVEQGNLSDS